jgi:Lrp/AsnC family transcriptional regulator of ectoine degradation
MKDELPLVSKKKPRVRRARGKSSFAGQGKPHATLDRIDLRILDVLQRNGRISKTALGAAVGLSPSACLDRIRRLEKRKLIRGYHAILDMKNLADLHTFYMEVTLRTHRAQDFSRFERHIQGTEEVIECHALGGGIDYLLKVVCPNVEYYQELVDRLLDAELGIERYFTYVVTKAVKGLPQLPVSTLTRSGMLDTE